MKAIRFFTLFATLTIVVACKTQESSQKNSACPAGELVDDFGPFDSSAAVTILDATIEKNIISLRISYGGGCGKHDFKLLGAKMIQKSLPPKRGVMLYHNSNGDTCRELIEETITFDISAFAYGKDEIILVLQGYDKPLSYTRE